MLSLDTVPHVYKTSRLQSSSPKLDLVSNPNVLIASLPFVTSKSFPSKSLWYFPKDFSIRTRLSTNRASRTLRQLGALTLPPRIHQTKYHLPWPHQLSLSRPLWKICPPSSATSLSPIPHPPSTQARDDKHQRPALYPPPIISIPEATQEELAVWEWVYSPRRPNVSSGRYGNPATQKDQWPLRPSPYTIPPKFHVRFRGSG